MHQHVAHPPVPDHTSGMIDSISDTLLNAFSRVRKPDERFLAMRESVDKFEDSVVLTERLWNRVRNRTNGEWSRFALGQCRLRLNETAGLRWAKISPATTMTSRLPSRGSVSSSRALRTR